MEKSNLTSGLVVQYRDGRKRLVVGNNLMGNDGWTDLELFNNDLTHMSIKDMDIMAMYKPENYSFHSIFNNLTLLWERKEMKMIPGEFYWNGQFIFQFAGFNKDLNLRETEDDLIIYDAIYAPDSGYARVKRDFGIGSLKDNPNIRPATLEEKHQIQKVIWKYKMVPEQWYKMRDWVFRYAGLKEDFTELSYGSNGAIAYDYLYNWGTHINYSTKLSIGIGTIYEAENQPVPATPIEIAIATMEHEKYYTVISTSGDKYTFQFDCIIDNNIHDLKCYSHHDQYIYNTPSVLIKIEQIAAFTPATPKEIELFNPKVEMTVEELEKKLGLTSGTLRIKRDD